MSSPRPSLRPAWSLGRFLRQFAVALLLFTAIGLGLWTFRERILIELAKAWIIEDAPAAKADAVAVLGSGLQYRTLEAIRIFKEGQAKDILIPNSRATPTDQMGLTTPEKETMRLVLQFEGIPTNRIHFVGHDTVTTFDAVGAVLAWARSNHVKTLVMPTDIFHTRRLRWVAHRLSDDDPFNPLDIRVTGIESREYGRTNWWQSEEGLIAFQNEVVKYLYYRMRF